MWFVLLLLVILWSVHKANEDEREFRRKLAEWQEVDRLAQEYGFTNPLPKPQEPTYQEPHGNVYWGMH